MPVTLEQIDACLPQTQCTRCSYPCCRDYAAAILRGEADINQCPPGGDISIDKLSSLTGKSPKPLNLGFGEYQPKLLAFINEQRCIGCVLCIKACPVDAIVGANKLMHTVIDSHCTGCELCLPVCPTDCIEMCPLPEQPQVKSDWPGYSKDDIHLARIRYQRRQQRLGREDAEKKQHNKLDPEARRKAVLEAVRRKQQMRNRNE